MTTPEPPSEAIHLDRTRACEYCAAVFVARRSDRRFCSDRCRLRHWRSRRTAASGALRDDHQLLDALRAEIDQLHREVADLRRALTELEQEFTRLRSC